MYMPECTPPEKQTGVTKVTHLATYYDAVGIAKTWWNISHGWSAKWMNADSSGGTGRFEGQGVSVYQKKQVKHTELLYGMDDRQVESFSSGPGKRPAEQIAW